MKLSNLGSELLVHYHHEGQCGDVQADMVLEKELRVQHQDHQAVGRESEPLVLAWASETLKPTPRDTPLQQSHMS